MLSILIPTYDYTCYKLAYDLHEQAEALGVPYEIIVADDGSKSQVNVIANLKINELSNCRYIRRTENVGRAAIRNFLIGQAKGDHLLLLDCDGKVVRSDFLAKYIEAGKTHDVVCGGIAHPDVCYDKSRMLRWKYEKTYERKYGFVSEQFRSFCFLLSRRAANMVHFDERFQHYGYEDVRYGMDLQRAGFSVFGIDNPLMNVDIEDNATFLRKTEEALRTAHQFEAEIGGNITAVSTYKKCKGCGWAIRLFHSMFGALIRKNLLSANPSLTLFSLYKLGYYSKLKVNS